MNTFLLRCLRRTACITIARRFKVNETVCLLPLKSHTISTNVSPASPKLPPTSILIEEEELPGYVAEEYYPVRIGQVFESRHCVLCKLGRGTGSTVWLSNDLQYVI